MKKKSLLIIGIGSLACSSALLAVDTWMSYEVQQTWDGNNQVELDAGDHTLDANTTSPGLFQSIFGPISGNTIDRASFKTAVSNAYTAGRGGVINFEDATQTFSGVQYLDKTRPNAADQLKAAKGGSNLITISRGPNWWFEADGGADDQGPYKGKQTAAFDGTGPSPADRSVADVANTFFFEDSGSGSRAELSPAGDGAGRALGLTSSYDLDFNIADQIGIVGFAVIQWDNFQSQQDGSNNYANYPNIHAIATFSDGLTTETQMAVGLTQGLTADNTIHDYYFGFEGSTGFYLENLDVYFIGNGSRVLAAIDDFGFVQVPEPSSAALMASLLAGLFVFTRRRR